MNEEERFSITAENHLELRGVDIVNLCEKHDTPLFIFDEQRLRDNFRRFQQAFVTHYPKTIVCYSVKTNNNTTICKIMQEEGAYAEVASSLDLYIAKKAGFPPERIIIDGLYKPETLLREALASNVLLINVESLEEIETLNEIAGETSKEPSIGIRVNPIKAGFNTETLYCNPLLRFGFSFEEALKAFKSALKTKNLKIKGIMTHPYWGIHEFLPFAKKIQEEIGIKLDYINFGGGFEKETSKIGIIDLMRDTLRLKLGMASKLDKPPKKVREIEEAGLLVSKEVKETFGEAKPTIIFEPGRYLIHDAGFLVLRAEVKKKVAGFDWIVADGGTNLISDWLERRQIRIANRANAPDQEIMNIVGPLLYARDFVTVKQRLPKIERKDLLVLSNAGAYTLSNSTQFMNPRPRAVLLSPDGKVSVVREKETYEDVVRMDRIS